MSEPLRVFRPSKNPASPGSRPPLSVAQVIELYLAFDAATRPGEAQLTRADRLRKFSESYGDRLYEDVIPADLEDWILGNPRWQARNTRKGVNATIQRAFNWAAKRRSIRFNPFRGVELPPGRRGRNTKAEEFRALMREASAAFRRILLFLRLSGSRPGELRALTWLMLSAELDCIIQQQHKTVDFDEDSLPRRILLCPILVKLLCWMRRRQMAWQELVFVNAAGRAWTRRNICKHLERLRTRAGVPEDCKLYGLRHGFATGAILNGVGLAELAELMGHKGCKTTMRYIHLAGQTKHLQAAVARAAKL